MLFRSLRYARAKEFIEVLRGLWAQTPFSFKGRFYEVEDAELVLKPATAAPPEIFTAARTSPGLDMVAETADWWFVDYPKTVADVREVEAESVAYICCSVLGLPGLHECRGYIQGWLSGGGITDKSAQRKIGRAHV